MRNFLVVQSISLRADSESIHDLAAVVVQEGVINRQPFTFCLTSRRSRHRAGTRYFTRGVDANGHTANSNETEQIIVVKGEKGEQVFSYVQTRGSVPVFWTQVSRPGNLPRRRDVKTDRAGASSSLADQHPSLPA